MKKVKWIGEARMIPNYGMGICGETKLLPVDIADSFIKQKLAEEIVPKAKQKAKKESE